MKNRLLIAAAALSLLASCTKEYTTVNTSNEPYRPPFRVSGVTDITFEKTPFGNPAIAYMPLQVTYGYGEEQRIYLQLSGIPQGIRDSLQISNGYPDFSTNALFFYENAANGNYPAKLSAKTDTGKTKEYAFNISVKGDTSCSGYLIGSTFQTISSCDGSSTPYRTSISRRGSGTNDTLYINNFQNDSKPLMCLINCRGGNVIIPYQAIDSSTYSGYGSIYYGSFGGGTVLNINVDRFDNSVPFPIRCSYSMTRN